MSGSNLDCFADDHDKPETGGVSLYQFIAVKWLRILWQKANNNVGFKVPALNRSATPIVEDHVSDTESKDSGSDVSHMDGREFT